MRIGEAIAVALEKEGVNLALLSRSKDKLDAVRETIVKQYPDVSVKVYPVDIQDYTLVKKAVESAVPEVGEIDILINNAGLALGAPARFWELPVEPIRQMNGTNVSGLMYATYFASNARPSTAKSFITPTRRASRASATACGWRRPGQNIRVMVLRPGCVATHFHLRRVKYEQEAIDEFFYGYEPLVAEDLADTVRFMLTRTERTSIKAVDWVPTAQRALTRFDREWNERNRSDRTM
ncbi:hypothetical protein BJY01DRAFT_234130 [Aspergillus pseudoustus]|uniref:Uncharacterized protein n=1 Tax=Aspergillus pseudoustus TaxID=1810923 RepID=A0ABR4K6B6_9EURO